MENYTLKAKEENWQWTHIHSRIDYFDNLQVLPFIIGYKVDLN